MSSTKEKDNFNKFSHGIVGIGNSIAQDVLAKFIPYNDLETTVRSYPIWHSLDRTQKSLISRAAIDGYKNFDITLTYKLLRNVCTNLGNPSTPNLPAPTRGWGKDPQPGDITPSDDIEKIRILKNAYYSHLPNPSMTDQEYNDKWLELEDICTRMQAYLGIDYPRQLQQIIEDFPEEDIDHLREVLYNTNYRLIQQVPVSPLQKSDKKLPIDLIFAPVIIRGDLEKTSVIDKPEKGQGKTSAADNKSVNNPSDIFYKNGEPARYIFMQGDAAHGKSVYCLRLLRYWCSAKEPGTSKALSEWETGLDEFDFVFPVLLRHVSKSRSNLLDMICYDMFKNNGECQKTIRHVLCNKKYKCLILLDGLDEWKCSPEAKSELTHPCIPNVETMSCCSYFITSRPWKRDQIREILDTSDRVIEIKGLDEKGVDVVIEKVLENFFDMDRETSEFWTKFQEMKQKSKDEKLKSIMQIPLLVTISCVLWYRKEKVADSMTGFYMVVVKLLIMRTCNTQESHDTERDEMNGKISLSEFNIPRCFKIYRTLQDFIDVLCTLGKVAYDNLISIETHLVFERYELEEKIDNAKLEFALKVGLLSTSEAPGSVGENVSVNIFHKTVQEFLAAVHIVCKSKIDSLIIHLTSIKVILELSNVIMFTLGLSPSLGNVLSQQIVGVANTDADICSYRNVFKGGGFQKVRLLYDLQLSCYREMKHEWGMSKSKEPLIFHVSDVHLNDLFGDMDTEVLRMSVDLMYNNPIHIVSMYLYNIPNDSECITDRELTQILDKATSLQYLSISGEDVLPRCISTVSNRFASLKSLYLEDVFVERDALCLLQRCMQHNKMLQSLTLRFNIISQDTGIKTHALLRGVLLCLPNFPFLSTLHIGYLYITENIHTFVDVLPRVKTYIVLCIMVMVL